MRQLTAKQKKVLDAWVDKVKVEPETKIFNSDAPFRVNGQPEWMLDTDMLPIEIWEELQKINDTEILWQEVNRYLGDVKI